MTRWRNFKDDFLYYSRAWEAFLAVLLALLILLEELWRDVPLALPLFGGLALLFFVWGLFRLQKGRRARLSLGPQSRPEKVKALRDDLFYDRAKEYFIRSGIFAFLLVLFLLLRIFTPDRSGISMLAPFYFLYYLVLGILSLRYERQQHQEFLNAHPEQK